MQFKKFFCCNLLNICFGGLFLSDCEEYVVKAQILAGGRGKGVFQPNGFKGGVHLTKE